MKTSLVKFLALFALTYVPAVLQAQEMLEEAPYSEEEAEAQYQAFLAEFDWKVEGKGDLGKWASIEIPQGYRFLNGKQTDELMQAFGNLPDEYEGMISDKNVDWFVLFQFSDIGYVKDDEKDALNAEKLLKQLKENDKLANQQRSQMGLGTLDTVGWAIKPRYNEQTHNLEWAVILRDHEGIENINYNTKLLGRNGIMNVTLVCDPDQLESVLANYQTIIAGHSYKQGKSYAEYESGDKVAEYGLTALIAGGALYGAAKTGMLANLLLFFKKGFKAIIVGVIAVGVAIKKFFGNMFGSGQKVRTLDSE